VRLLARVHALQAFATTEDGTNLLAGYKRAANILKKENHPVIPAQAGAQNTGAELDSGLRRNDDSGDRLPYTPEPAEQALIDALATLRAPIDRFFEEVTVNADAADKRAARLALLARFRDAVHRVADFSRIEG
jgi:glycyl-tRNA synthetase beta chain